MAPHPPFVDVPLDADEVLSGCSYGAGISVVAGAVVRGDARAFATTFLVVGAAVRRRLWRWEPGGWVKQSETREDLSRD